MLMTGPSRTAFHAVPCVLTKPVDTAPSDIGTCPLVLSGECGTQIDCYCDTKNEHLWRNEMGESQAWKEFSDYIKCTRININIRQVHRHKVS